MMGTTTGYDARKTALVVAVCAALLACTQIQQGKDDTLIGAGFTPVPANTPQRQAALATKPHMIAIEIRFR
jgi:hypothetical protein